MTIDLGAVAIGLCIALFIIAITIGSLAYVKKTPATSNSLENITTTTGHTEISGTVTITDTLNVENEITTPLITTDQISASSVRVVGKVTSENIQPITTNTFDIGSTDVKWKDLFLGGNNYNSNLFGTKLGGGIFSQQGLGPLYNSGAPFSASTLVGTTAVYSTPSIKTFGANTFSLGDCIDYNLEMKMNFAPLTPDPLDVTFSLSFGGTSVASVLLSIPSAVTNGIVTWNGSFTCDNIVGTTGSFTAINKIQQGTLLPSALITFTTNIAEDIVWDLRVASGGTFLGTGDFDIQSSKISMTKKIKSKKKKTV